MITIHTEFVWDMHQDGNNVGVKEGQDIVMRPFDHAVSAFIEDVEARGLSDKILLVCCRWDERPSSVRMPAAATGLRWPP